MALLLMPMLTVMSRVVNDVGCQCLALLLKVLTLGEPGVAPLTSICPPSHARADSHAAKTETESLNGGYKHNRWARPGMTDG